ncbi:MAG: hypothetical protein A3J62_04175 [Candidatus Buchananbacteria bacterium RIFCSPHIGHO2_02_FULL_38_8]|uniref:Uncharacterized protein n=2 Tax=Candidatus Buchananiibacteriota TaxID=1817903 RepID=A0A1G1XU51_9BACT|nr:MAG: hypothetical protein A2731_01645 [Candidatus Buchananbacteria bacterium RIFCSPHIGHO2_01_FULL_39_8]OGY47657.1 MAG: hypothetical protein A3J62_04175 [Candidatus Buchananbacteria bacterium RIFCSPHIGHO2_02_FULL_38_8]
MKFFLLLLGGSFAIILSWFVLSLLLFLIARLVYAIHIFLRYLWWMTFLRPKRKSRRKTKGKEWIWSVRHLAGLWMGCVHEAGYPMAYDDALQLVKQGALGIAVLLWWAAILIISLSF